MLLTDIYSKIPPIKYDRSVLPKYYNTVTAQVKTGLRALTHTSTQTSVLSYILQTHSDRYIDILVSGKG